MPWPVVTRLISQLILPIQNIIMFFITGKATLERIMANRSLPFPSRVYKIKYSIDFKSSKDLHDEVEQAKNDKNKSLIHDQLYTVMHKLELYQNLIKKITEIRTTKVTSTEPEHLELFENIWSRLVTQSDDDHEQMSMISKRWTRIGFQV